MSNSKNINECSFCHNTHTSKIYASDPGEEANVLYVGWCFDCHRPYALKRTVDNVDTKGLL